MLYSIAKIHDSSLSKEKAEKKSAKWSASRSQTVNDTL